MGGEPPARLPDAVVAAIRSVERALDKGAASPVAGEGPPAFDVSRRWTLTWLEGRPLVELDPAPDSDEVTVIRFSPTEGTASITTGDSDEEWVEE